MIDLTKLPEGTSVNVKLDDGSTEKTKTRSAPWRLGHGDWVVKLDGIPGGYSLDRVSIPDEDCVAEPPVAKMTAVEVLQGLDEILSFDEGVYTVRSLATEDQRWGPWGGDSWDHPKVKRWSELCNRAHELIKDGES